MKKFQHDSRARVTRARVTHRRTLRLPGRLWRARPVRRPPTAGRRAQSVRGLLTAGRCACPAGYSGLSGGYSRRARTSRGCAPQRASWDRGGPPLSHGPNPGAGAACINAAPAPLFAAQPTKVFCRGFFFQKSRKVFCRGFFFKKAGTENAARQSVRLWG